MKLINKNYKENIKLIDGNNRKVIIDLDNGATFSIESCTFSKHKEKHCFFRDPDGNILMTAPNGQVTINNETYIIPSNKNEVAIANTPCTVTCQKNVINAAHNYFSLFFNYYVLETPFLYTNFVINSQKVKIFHLSSNLPEIKCNFSHN
jgi:hypothetical protein